MGLCGTCDLVHSGLQLEGAGSVLKVGSQHVLQRLTCTICVSEIYAEPSLDSPAEPRPLEQCPLPVSNLPSSSRLDSAAMKVILSSIAQVMMPKANVSLGSVVSLPHLWGHEEVRAAGR